MTGSLYSKIIHHCVHVWKGRNRRKDRIYKLVHLIFVGVLSLTIICYISQMSPEIASVFRNLHVNSLNPNCLIAYESLKLSLQFLIPKFTLLWFPSCVSGSHLNLPCQPGCKTSVFLVSEACAFSKPFMSISEDPLANMGLPPFFPSRPLITVPWLSPNSSCTQNRNSFPFL